MKKLSTELENVHTHLCRASALVVGQIVRRKASVAQLQGVANHLRKALNTVEAIIAAHSSRG